MNSNRIKNVKYFQRNGLLKQSLMLIGAKYIGLYKFRRDSGRTPDNTSCVC
jgi:hypothetical protein